MGIRRVSLIVFSMVTIFSIGLSSNIAYAGPIVDPECSMFAEWDTLPSSPSPPDFSGSEPCPAGPLSPPASSATLECNTIDILSTSCTASLPNFDDDLSTKLIFIEIVYDEFLFGQFSPSPTLTVGIDLSDGPVVCTEISSGPTGFNLFEYVIECLPNPDFEIIEVTLPFFSFISVEFFTHSFDDNGPPTVNPGDMIGSGGNLGIDPGSIFLVSQVDGSQTFIGDPTVTGGVSGLTFDSTGRLFGSSVDTGIPSSDLIEIDPLTGALINNIGTINDGVVNLKIADLAVQPGTDNLFGITNDRFASELFTIDKSNAFAIFVGPTGTGVGAIGFAPDGTLFFVQRGDLGDTIQTLDPTNANVLTSFPRSESIELDALGVRSDGTIFVAGAPFFGDGRDIWTIDTSGFMTLKGNGIRQVADLTFVPDPLPGVSINDVSLAEGNAGLTPFTFTVTRSDNTDAISVDFATSDGTATLADNDYQAAGATLSFTAGGALTQTITVQVVGDITVEPNETFFVDLSGCAGCTFTDNQGQGTIQNDDGTPIGGSDVSINTSALLLAGAQSISMWMIPVVIAGIGIGIFVIKRRK